MNSIQAAITGQARRNRKLLNDTKHLGERITHFVGLVTPCFTIAQSERPEKIAAPALHAARIEQSAR